MRHLNLQSILKNKTVGTVIVCRPRGGLNDMLCQIEKCWRYAETHKRHLVVDTWRSGFLDDFSRYFLPRDDSCVTFGHFDESLWKGKVRPKNLKGRINSYKTVYSHTAGNFVDARTQELLTIDLDRPYREQILVHEQCGGGTFSINALERLKLIPSIAEIITKKFEDLGEYSAVHVRNSDYQTDYHPLFQEVRTQASHHKIVLCTDDWHCQASAREIFGDRIYMSSDIPDTKGRPLHNNPELDRYQTNLDAITDLFVLASARQLFVGNHTQGILSGYSMLAKILNERRDVIHHLLGKEIPA